MKDFPLFNFNLKTAEIYQAIKWERQLIFQYAGFLKKLFLILFVVSFFLFLHGFLLENFLSDLNKKLLGFVIISLVFLLIFQMIELFLNLKLKKPKLKVKIEDVLKSPEKYNAADFLSFEVAKAFWQAIQFSRKKKFSKISSETILYFSLKEWLEANFIFNRALLPLKEIKKELKNYLDNLESKEFQEVLSENSQIVILEAVKFAQKKGHQRIEIDDLIIALARHDPIFKKILVNFKLKAEDIENLTWWLENIKKRIENRKKFWQYENLMRKGTLAKEWTAGYTITLDQFSIDITEKTRKCFYEIIGHTAEIARVERILSNEETNNVLLIGESGSGRKSVINAVAQKSFLGQSLPKVNYKRVVELDLVKLLSQLTSSEEVEMVLDKIFQEAVLAGNIILVIDNFHNYIGQIVRPGVIDISGILSSYLVLPQFQIIAITNFADFHRYIEPHSSFLSLFEKVEILEISVKDTLQLLEDLALFLEKKYKRFISYQALLTIVSLAERYIPALAFPEKAIDILNEVIIYVAQTTKDPVVLPEHVAKIITEKTQVPVGEIETKEREILLNLEKLIHQRIINQEEAVKEISTALKRARTEVTIRKGPMGVFLFLGPTGVGKTETSKALAEIYFGSENKMIRMDMSEFQAVEDIPRLLGKGDEGGLLTTSVRENPFSLILLDEIEKAHPNILNLFLQVFDEGHLTDGRGRKVDFKNSIIIATSNAGYQIILKAIKERQVFISSKFFISQRNENLNEEIEQWSKVKQKLFDYLFEKGIFRPELINRFDGVVIFRPLSKENLLDITQLLLQKLSKNLEEKGIEFVITKALKEKIVKLGYNPVFGARQIRRVIQDKVENPLSVAILSNELKRGNRVKVNPKDFTLIINP